MPWIVVERNHCPECGCWLGPDPMMGGRRRACPMGCPTPVEEDDDS